MLYLKSKLNSMLCLKSKLNPMLCFKKNVNLMLWNWNENWNGTRTETIG